MEGQHQGGVPARIVRHPGVTWRHIGDARIGKWREGFDGEVGSALTHHFFPFLLRFGYSPA